MKRLLMSIMLAMVLVFQSIPSYSWDNYDDFNRAMGKSSMNTELHMGLGGLAAAGTIYFLPKEMDPVTKWFIGFGAGLVAGCVSEFIDTRYGYSWDNKDLAQWGLGGAFGSSLMLMNIKFSL